MIDDKTKQFLSIPKRHPLAFAALYIPVIISVIVSSAIYRFTFAYCLPMLWCFIVSLFLIQGVIAGELTDNHGTAIRRQAPIRFWAKVSFWSVFYLFAIAWCIGFALQEQRKESLAPTLPLSSLQVLDEK